MMMRHVTVSLKSEERQDVLEDKLIWQMPTVIISSETVTLPKTASAFP